MKNRAEKRIIGFSSMAWQEMANRRMEGVLRYFENSDEFVLRDFRFMRAFQLDNTSPPPPWTGKADGIIACLGAYKDEIDAMHRWFGLGGVPVVSLTNEWRHPKIPIVCTDNNALMRTAMEYLIRQGHEHFAFISDTLNPRGAQQRKFLEKLLRAEGHELLSCDLAQRPRGSVEDLDQAVKDVAMTRFLREAPKPLAVFAVTDLHARAVCWICEELELDIPGEVAIIGTGNLTVSRSHNPTISSVETPHDRVGFEAMKLLHRLMDGGKAPSRAKLIPPTEIIERETTCIRKPPEFGDVRLAMEFIQAHACEGVSVKELVINLGINRRTLEKHFRNSIGHSPGQEIQNIRMARAKKLLAETDLSIIRVSQMTGFREPTRLNRFFRKHAEMTPSEYRKQARDE
ncbi:MAG: substrate-binding domain-containing protein [Phycisphaerales bacterium]|nr:substrate-binding domain-containing protein [Phycisphaerales bacterium]